MLSYVKIALALIQLVQYFVKRADEKRLISQGEKQQIAAALSEVNQMVTEAKHVENSVDRMSSDAVSDELSRYYATDPGPGIGGDRRESLSLDSATGATGRFVLPDQQEHPGRKN
jgi:hypothetical protein